MRKLYTAALFLSSFGLAAWLLTAQTIPSFTAITDNVATHDSVRINILRWSTDAERDQLLAAWNLTRPASTEGRGGRGNRGGRAGDDGLAPENSAASGGRGGRGGRGGQGGAPAATRTPESSLAAALGQAPTVGYLWSSEVAGYSLRYATRLNQPDGGSRIILITDRRLGAFNNSWKVTGPAGEATPNYEFSLIELRLNAKGEGEGKASLAGKIAADPAMKIIALEDYAAAPVILKNVKMSK